LIRPVRRERSVVKTLYAAFLGVLLPLEA